MLFMDGQTKWHVKQPTASVCIADFYAREIKLCVSVTNNLERHRQRLNGMGFHVMAIDMQNTHPSEAAERIWHRARILRELKMKGRMRGSSREYRK
jgi:hypothetical protein